VLAALLQFGSIVTRGLAADRWPLGNMYEFTSAVCLAAVVTWLVVLRRLPALRAVALFVLLPVVILLFLGGTVLYARAAPVVPALRSYWLVVHVTTITVSSGLLLVPGVASLLFLLRRSGRGGAPVDRLPSAATLDRLAYRTTIVAFPLYTFGVIAGAIWAEAAWGRFWGWDPKETVAFVAWVVYAAYLHARATAGWRTGRAAWINVAGWAVVLFNLFFINMVVAGLHSYAGI
jgi:cytochrome c-type biogenesis protein CcsB